MSCLIFFNSFAGLHCKVISGLVKGANFQIGTPMNPDDFQHWWNAVYIYGKWCLVDSYLATIPLINKTGSGELKYSFNEHYFLVDPNKMIYSHFPDEPVWQLSSNVVSRDEFILLPKITLGVYSLHIFAKEDTPTGKDISFSQVCEYQLNQEQEPKRVICPYPPCSSLLWGPGPGFYQLGLTPGNNRAIVHTKHG